MKVNIAYLYPEELNLYGDTGNVEILVYRLRKRGFDVELRKINSTTKVDVSFVKDTDILFMGGGPDSGQKEMYQDLVQNKGPYIKEYVENGGVSLFICGSYQLMGKYYKSADGTVLDGLGVFDLYTQHFGHDKPRCVGNTLYELSGSITTDPVFKNLFRGSQAVAHHETHEYHELTTIVGFENHGGRTYLSQNMKPFAKVLVGYGNNSEDKTEGVHYKNSIGTYSHGPILSKNPQLADYLIYKSLALRHFHQTQQSTQAPQTEQGHIQSLTYIPLDDRIILQAHSALIKKIK